MASDALQFAPQILHQMKGLKKLHNPDKFLEGSSFGSNLIILDLFWVVFYGTCANTLPVMQRKVMTYAAGFNVV